MPAESLPALTIGPALGRALDVARAVRQPALLVGAHGIGKSEYLARYAEERGLAFHALDLSLLEATDLTGLPWRDGNVTRFAPTAHLPASDASGPSLLVIEELNRCDRSVRQPCLQLLTARTLNDYRLPASCHVVACINPPGASYEVDELDPALRSRFVQLAVEPDRASWARWARDEGLDEAMVTFVERSTRAFQVAPPRSWTQAARLRAGALAQAWPDDEVQRLLRGVLPDSALRALELALQPDDPIPEASKLLRQPTFYVQWLREHVRGNRLDVVRVVVDRLRAALATEEGQVLAGRTPGVRTLLSELPPDLAAALLASIRAAA